MEARIINHVYELRKILHRIPEIAFHEEKTKAVIMDELKQLRDITVVDCGVWFYAVSEGKKENAIAFRADFDAVEGNNGKAGHFCGHDGHASILVGLAEYLSKNPAERTVYMIFQPAEEIGQGALLCRKLIKEKEIREVYGFHNIPGFPKGSILSLRGTFACASTGLEVSFMGNSSHAAYPEAGKNPAEAIARLILRKDQLLRQPYHGLVLATVIGAEIGSKAYGVSAGSGVLRLTIRAELESEYQKLVEEFCTQARTLAEESGIECRIRKIEEFPSTENHAESIEKLEKAAERTGKTIIHPSEPFRWSEDFGYYLQITEGAFFGVGSGEDCPQLHTQLYEFPDEIAETVLDLYVELLK